MTKKKDLEINFTEEVQQFTQEATRARFPDWCAGGFGPGWWPILYKFFTHVENTLDRYNVDRDKFQVGQIKEKLGGMRIYCHLEGWQEDPRAKMAHEQISELRNVAYDEADKTCEMCGQPGSMDEGKPGDHFHWYKVKCPSCLKQGVGIWDAIEIFEKSSR